LRSMVMPHGQTAGDRLAPTNRDAGESSHCAWPAEPALLLPKLPFRALSTLHLRRFDDAVAGQIPGVAPRHKFKNRLVGRRPGTVPIGSNGQAVGEGQLRPLPEPPTE
jgi:hypothetical protein